MLLMQRPISIVVLSVTLMIMCVLKAQGQSKASATFKVEKTKDFDFRSDRIARNWSKTKWVRLIQIKGEKTKGYYTKVKVLYSKTGIYFLFECGDQVLTAAFHQNFKKLWKQDVVEVFFQPDDKYPIYLEYELSPLNYELPILNSIKRGDHARWIPFLYDGSDRQTRHIVSVKGGEQKSGASVKQWIAKIFIPYKLLNPLDNVPPKRGTRWKANFYRIDYDMGNIKWWAWQPVKKSFHELKSYGAILFE
jgi:hypothetical protein